MATQLYDDFFGALAHVQLDVDKLRQIIQGDDQTTVSTISGDLDSVAKTIADLKATINQEGDGWLAVAQAAAGNADSAAATANSSADDAVQAKTAALAAATAALASKSDAITAAVMAGITHYAETYAEADALADTLADDDAIMIFNDENNGGTKTVRLVTGNTLTDVKRVFDDAATAVASVLSKVASTAPGEGASLVKYKNELTVQQMLPPVQVDNLKDLCDAWYLHIDKMQFQLRAFFSNNMEGGGLVTYKANVPRSNANGVTIIDPTSFGTLSDTALGTFHSNQGLGSGNGCLVRLDAAILGATAPISRATTAMAGAHNLAADHSDALDAWAALPGILIVSDFSHNYNNAAKSMTIVSDNLRVKGKGQINALSELRDLFIFSGDNIELDGPYIKGNGVFTDNTAIASPDRRSLIRIDGKNCWVKNCILEDGPQNFVQWNNVGDNAGGAINNDIIGGPLSVSDTGHQGLRLYGAGSGWTVSGNRFRKNAAGGYPGECIIASQNGKLDRIRVSNNNIEAAHDHGIYLIGVSNSEIISNITTTIGGGIVVTGQSTSGGVDVAGNNVAWNICHADTNTASGEIGLYMRDSNHSNCAYNTIKGFPSGIRVAPVQYDDPTNTLSHNTVVWNKVEGCLEDGVALQNNNRQLFESVGNIIENNTIIYENTGTSPVGFGILATMDAPIELSDISIHRNKIWGAPGVGIFATKMKSSDITSNRILSPGQNASAWRKSGIFTSLSEKLSVIDNVVVDTTGKMESGISGNNSTTKSFVANNTITGATAVSIHKMQQAGHGNTFRSNKIGDNPLSAEVTLAAAATTTVLNDNAHASSGYERFIRLTPTNAAAATLAAGAGAPYISAQISGTSFDITTADGSAAVGTETFYYEIMG